MFSGRWAGALSFDRGLWRGLRVASGSGPLAVVSNILHISEYMTEESSAEVLCVLFSNLAMTYQDALHPFLVVIAPRLVSSQASPPCAFRTTYLTLEILTQDGVVLELAQIM